MNTKEILDPIADLFTGADGGVAFILLRETLTELIKTNPEHTAVISFRNVSLGCSHFLSKSQGEG